MHTFGERAYHLGISVRTTGHGPQLILIHGGSGSRTHWARNIRALSARFTVITPDLPGFGESARPPQALTTADYVAWVAEAVRLAAEDQPFHLAGFSFGGAISAAITARLARQGHAPDRLTLVSPSGFGIPTGRSIELERIKKGDNVTQQEIRAATARNLGRWMLAKPPAADDPAVDIHLSNVEQARFDSRPISYEASLLDHLQDLTLPIQILLGAQDPLIFPSVSDRKALLDEALPTATVDIIAEAGHWLQYEASSAVDTRIQQFHQ